MDEKETKDNIDSTNNLWTENNNDNDFVEVIENEKIENPEENIQNQNNTYPSSANKLTSVVYLVIFISILIWVYFYVTQNKDILDKLTGKDNTNSWQIETITWETDNTITNTGIESDNVNTDDIENNNLKENTDNINNEKDPSTSASTTINNSWASNQNEDAIIKDFENELDSLFNMIDENAK
jgi:hypothetical protein